MDQSQGQDHQPGTSRVTRASSQRLLKRPATGALDQAPSKKLAKCTSQDNSTRRVSFTPDTKHTDGGSKVLWKNLSPLHRMINLGLDNSIPLFHLNRACQELLPSFSDPEDLLLLGLYARGRGADSEFIKSIEEKLAIALCSDFLLDIQPVFSYKDTQCLHQDLVSTKKEGLETQALGEQTLDKQTLDKQTLDKQTLDKRAADCMSTLRSAIVNRATIDNLSDVLERYQYCGLSKVCDLYSNYRSESLKNSMGGFALADSSVNEFLGRLATIIPDDVLVSKYLEDLENLENLES